jgi:hypothetical protein
MPNPTQKQQLMANQIKAKAISACPKFAGQLFHLSFFRMLVFIFLLFTVPIGCTSPPPKSGNWTVLPKLIKGTIENNTYTAPNKTFSISLPHTKNSSEYHVMDISEGLDQELTYVILVLLN